MTVRSAIIGCGDISAVHFGALAALEHAELVAICDVDAARLSQATAKYSVPGFEHYEDLIRNVQPDVVHICTPHDRHADIAAYCLEQGVNVVLEKPVAHTLAEAERLSMAARNSTGKIAVCFQNRYNTTAQAMHDLLSTGDLGPILGASASVMWHRTAQYYRDRPWRGTWANGGGGLLMNQAIHTIDLLQWLVGDVQSVQGRSATRALADVIEVDDTAEFVAVHSNGARSVFYATLAHAVNAPVTLEIVTEKALLRLQGDLTITYADGQVDRVTERQAHATGPAYWGVSHELLIQDFYGQLGSGTAFWIDADEAQKSLRIVKEIYRQSYPEALNTVS